MTFLTLPIVPLVWAQDDQDLTGTWVFETTTEAMVEKCGERKLRGELTITRKITARAYRGRVFTQESTTNCVDVSNNSSELTLRIRDDDVTLDYDKDGWYRESFTLDGNTLTGKAGVETTWVKQQVAKAGTEGPYAAEIDEYLDGIRQEFYEDLGDQYGTNILRNLRRTGLDSERAREVTGKTLERMTDCILDMAREKLISLDMPLEQLLVSHKAKVIMQPRNMDYRDHECIHDAAMNAGVVIR